MSAEQTPTTFIVSEAQSCLFYPPPPFFHLCPTYEIKYINPKSLPGRSGEHILFGPRRSHGGLDWPLYPDELVTIIDAMLHASVSETLEINSRCSIKVVPRFGTVFVFETHGHFPWEVVVKNDTFIEGLRLIYPEIMEPFNVC